MKVVTAKTTLLLVALYLTVLAIVTATADPYTITAWFEDEDTSFNMRFDPFHVVLPDAATVRLFFPPGTIQARDRRDMNCSLYSNGNRRYYEQPDLKPQNKYGNGRAAYLDIHWPASWFNPNTDNLLIRCYGLKITPDDLQVALQTPNNESYSVWLDNERRQYTLKTKEECILPDGKRF